MDDIFDTRFEGKEIELEDNRVEVGDDINLTAKDPAMSRVMIGLGWDFNNFEGDSVDLDVSVFLLDKNNMTRVDEDFVFYNNMQALDGAVSHDGDNRTGAGEGDDETVSINLHGIPFDVLKLMFVVSIYKGAEKDQRLGMVRRAYIRLVNPENRFEILRYELNSALEDRNETAMLVGSLNREGPKWHFTPLDEFVEGGLAQVATNYGIVVQNQ